MNRKIFKNIIILLILLMSFFITNIAYAAGSFSVNKSSVTLIEGKTTTFEIDGANATGRVNITSSNTSVATVSSASVWLEKNSTTITITAKKAGTSTITVSGKVSDSKGAEATITKTISVTVEAEKEEDSNNNGSTNNNIGNNTGTDTNTNTGTTNEKTKSTNAYLSTLGVTPKQYDFSGFKKTTLNYSVTIPYEVDSLKVLYKTAHSGATVNVTGNSGFEVGSNNKITIKVTAEDGKTTKTYTIKVTKLVQEEEKPGNIIEEPEDGIFLTSLNIKGVDVSPEFSKDIYTYTATLSKNNITAVEVKAEANKENAIIEVSGNTNLVIGENTINIIVKEKGGTAQAVYQVTLTKEATLVTTEENENNFMNNLIDNIKNYVVIAIAVVVLIIVTIIILIVLLIKENKKLKKEETEEYNIYQNDKNEQLEGKIEEQKEEVTNETQTKNKGKRTVRKEKGRHSK